MMCSQLAAAQVRLRVDYPDEDLRRRISSYLGSRHFPAFRQLDVRVADGAVTLTGRVSSFYEKQVALDTCRRVAGVLSTIDQVQVEPPATISPPLPTAAAIWGRMETVRAGRVEPGGSGSRLEFPVHVGVGVF
jgi:hypothetical protein